MTKPIQVMIVDDHAMVRSGLSAFLMAFDDLELVGEAGDGHEALQKCEKLQPDVILMDLMMPKMDGVSAIQAIRSIHPHIQIIALTSFKDNDLMNKALESGAIGYLLKNVAVDDLAQAIRSAYVGQATLAPEATQALVYAMSHNNPPINYNLTIREKHILSFLIKGMSNPEIADFLTISRATVRFHVSNIFSKLDVTNRTEAVALAIQHDLVNQPSNSDVAKS